ncbi:MAG: hypothetical protein KOO62_09500 [candidate division Zixibacteria bacterium]|nr:hypothetical protein [candidate division Zixibacteria bacterium]
MRASVFRPVLLVLSLIICLPSVSNAGLASSFGVPDTIYASNTVIDIVEHSGGVWLATGEGLNYSLDGGQTWLLYDSDNGMVSDEVSALFSLNGRLWIGNGHSEIIGGESVGFSDALEYTDDNGYNWFEADLGEIANVLGGQRSIYDITGHYDESSGDEWVFFTGWAGGLVGSKDGGTSWRRILLSPGDSVYYINQQLRLRDLYFSCAVDTTHGDSLFLWTGSAEGIFKFAFAPPREKPLSEVITAIEFCNDCGAGDSSRVFIGGNNGITRGNSSGGPFISWLEDDGLPGAYISMLHAFDGRLFVGTMEGADGPSTGLTVTADGGESFEDLSSSFDAVIGENRKISGMTSMRSRLYLAAETAGLFVSIDTGQSWSHIWVDSSDTSTANKRNVVHDFDVLSDTLRIGTDSGLVTWYMDSAGTIESYRYDVFVESPVVSSARVIEVKTQVFRDSLGVYDSLAVWTINHPLTDSGGYAVMRSSELPDAENETDTVWINIQGGIRNDLAIMGDTVFMVGDVGIHYTFDGVNANFLHSVPDTLRPWITLDDYPITVMAVTGDTVFVGSENGFAISNNRSQSYRIYRVNSDSLRADLITNYTASDVVYPIPGNFVPALEVQTLEDENYSRVWASTRPTEAGQEVGITMGVYKPMDSIGNVIDSDTLDSFAGYGIIWQTRIEDVFAWNFAFNGDSVFAATTDGLLFTDQDAGMDWDTIAFINEDGDVVVDTNAAVYAVQAIGDWLYVGTDQSTVRLGLTDLVVDTNYFFMDSVNEVYAFPIPFSQSANAVGVNFHFILEKESDVTLEIYDVAMNLVSRVIDGQRFPSGVYHGRNTGIPTWDGRNGKGDEVAVGVYYFKVETSNGDVQWGKLAVIP